MFSSGFSESADPPLVNNPFFKVEVSHYYTILKLKYHVTHLLNLQIKNK